MTFTHLHVASCFSSHYGTATPEELAQEAASYGATALALTDRDGLFGAIKHLLACSEYGLSPILGADLAVTDSGRITVLATGSASGYAALCRTVSAAHESTAASGSSGPQVSRERLAELVNPAENATPQLHLLIGPESDAGIAAGARRYRETRAALRRWREQFGAAVHVELVTHLSTPGEELSTAHAVRMLSAAAACRVPAVLTNAVRLLNAEEAPTADVLDAVRMLSDLNSAQNLQPTDQGWLKTAPMMQQIADEICAASTTALTAEQLLKTTEKLADGCRLNPQRDLGIGTPTVPEASVIGINGDADQELRARCETGLGVRIHQQEVQHRLNKELEIIADLGFASYFLTVAEVVRLIKELGSRCAARGSSVSSLVVHALGISPIDPLQHELIFERFLSGKRSTLPDIDIDVESARRHEIYRKVFQRFGSQRVTLLSMQNTYRIRGAVRDAGMALGLSEQEIDELAEIMWRFPASDFRAALKEKPELRGLAERLDADRLAGRQQLDLLVDLTERLDRLPRHISTHPCGVILGDKSLLNLTPVQPSGVTGLPMTQYDKDDMDPAGFIKLDILGVRMQSTIAYCLEEIQRSTGVHVDLETIGYEDPDTFALIQSTHTLGCFQIESPGQRELIGKLVPKNLEDLILDISLFRPGPMGAGMVTPFLERRHRFISTTYTHPHLEPILAETHGVVVYHEQVLRIFDRMTDCGLDEADEMRRKLSDPETVQTVEYWFRQEAAGKDYSPTVIDTVWKRLTDFGSFGFCKAHGAAFAIPTYQSAWLKAHYPVAFLTGLFEHDPGMYPLRLLVAEARRLGVTLLPIDVNTSTGNYRMERVNSSAEPDEEHVWGIRMALSSLKGISQAEIRRIEKEQPFASLADLRDRASPRRSTLRSLAEIGALDTLLPSGRPRNDLIQWIKDTTASSTSRAQHSAGQLCLPLPDIEIQQMPSTTFSESTETDLVATEMKLTKIDISHHVMSAHYDHLQQAGVTFAEDLLSQRAGTWVRVAGIRVATQTPPMASGRRVVFISLDDGTGLVDISLFDEAQAANGEALFTTTMLMAEGKVRRTGPRAVTVQATKVWDMQAAPYASGSPEDPPALKAANPSDPICVEGSAGSAVSLRLSSAG